VAVVGGGISGLVAARDLARAGARVTVFEAGTRLGGQVHTVPFAGRQVDVGAEALHAAAPQVGRLIADLGLEERLVAARPGSAWIWTTRGLRPLPAGVGPGGPTRLGPVLRANVLSPAGLARAALEPLLPRTPVDPDIGVGTYLARRFGPQVRDRLVDPVLGALHAGDVDRLSLQAAAPQLAAVAGRHRSLLLAHRARRNGQAPTFVTFRDGLVTLVRALTADPAITVRRSAPVVAIHPDAGGYRVEPVGAAPLRVDGVVLAVPAKVALGLLAPIAPETAGPLDALPSVSVATVLAAYPTGSTSERWAFHGTGVLVPSDQGRLLKAATFLSRKWDHLATPDLFLVRLSAGRAGGPAVAELGDHELVERLHADLADMTGLAEPPVSTHVERWPGAMAQLQVGHPQRLATIRRALESWPNLALAGAPYDGVGLAACISSGQRAAAAVAAPADLLPVGAR
jgi:oxygen-dependent protoporphyrinogen oxidase